METVLVQLTHHKAMKLLLELEELQVIRLLKKDTAGTEKLSEKYAGKLPKEAGEKLRQLIEKGR